MHLTVNFADLINSVNFSPVVVVGLGAVAVYAASVIVIMFFLKGSK